MGQDAPDWGLEEEAGYTMEVGESKVWTRRVSVWVKWCPCQAKCGAFKSERTLVSLKIGYAREAKEHRSGHVKVNLNAP